MRNKSEHRAKLDDFESKMDQARVQYENFFSGIEGREPTWLRNEITKSMKFFRRCKFNSHADKNRFSTLATRFGILTRNWSTIKREQEEGHIRPKHMRGRQQETPPEDALGVPSQPTPAPTQPPPPRPEPTPPTAAKAHTPATKKKIAYGEPLKIPHEVFQRETARPLYTSFMEAKKQCSKSSEGNETTEELSFAEFCAQLEHQIPQLQQRGYQKIQFQIFILNGEATLKAMGKKPT